MKKRILIPTVLALLIAAAGIIGVHAVRNRIETVDAELFVNGEETGIHVQISSSDTRIYSMLPLIAVMQELGSDVEWMDSNQATVDFRGVTFLLNLEEHTFFKEGTDSNLLIPAPGSTTFSCTVQESEIMLDDNTLHSVLTLMRIPAYIHNRPEERQVYIIITE